MYYNERKAEMIAEFGEFCKRYGICGITSFHYRSMDNGDATKYTEEVLVTYESGYQMVVNISYDSYDGVIRDLYNQGVFEDV